MARIHRLHILLATFGAAAVAANASAQMPGPAPTPTLPWGSRARALLEAKSPETIRKELIGIDWSVMKASQAKDRATLESLLAPDFTVTRLEDGKERIVGTRQDFLESRQTIQSWLLVESNANIYGNVATVVSRLALRSGFEDGTRRDGEFLLVDVWKNGDSTWKMVSRFTSAAEKKCP